MSLATGYVSPSQVARRVTEHWADQNLYCLACPSPHLQPAPVNTAVLDFRCPRCHAEYQLKSKSGPFGRKVQNSAYGVKLRAIEQGDVPNYVFLQYSRVNWLVREVFVLPGHFVTPAVIEPRKALGPQARRSGWVGSNILLHALPVHARVAMTEGDRVYAPGLVRQRWRRFAFLGQDVRARGGWGADVLDCLRELQAETGMEEFSLQAFYDRFERTLAARHPANRHVRDKIRQQLQVLRDGGVIRFVGRGRYRIVA